MQGYDSVDVWEVSFDLLQRFKNDRDKSTQPVSASLRDSFNFSAPNIGSNIVLHCEKHLDHNVKSDI